MTDFTLPYPDPGVASFELVGNFINHPALLAGQDPELKPAYSFPLANSTAFDQFSVVGLDGSGKIALATEGGIDGGISAVGVLTFSGTGTADDTVTIGATVYTLVAAPAAAYEVKIGGSAAATALNLIAAVNGGAGEGDTYGTDTVPHPNVRARSNASAVVGIVAQDPGTGGNAIATTEAGTGASFGAATLTGGLDGAGIQAIGVLAHAASLGASGSANGHVFYSGCFNSDALVWHGSFTTDAQKAAAFFGAPTPTTIIARKRAI